MHEDAHEEMAAYSYRLRFFLPTYNVVTTAALFLDNAWIGLVTAIALLHRRALGFRNDHTQSAFYLYPNAKAFTEDSFGFCLNMLEHAVIATTPCIYFCFQQAEQHVRFAYTTSLPCLQEGVDGLGHLENLGRLTQESQRKPWNGMAWHGMAWHIV